MSKSTNEVILQKFLPQEFNYAFLSSSHVEGTEEFSCKLRCNLKTEDMVKNWLKAFEEKTCTKWLIRDVNLCDSIDAKFDCSRDYVCQLNSKGKTENSKRNHNCKAHIKFRIKRDSKWVRCRDKFAKRGLIAVVNISFKHSHRVKNAMAWNLLRPTSDTLRDFKEYFRNGE
jgi:hypothetical protein